ncbi:MAG: hypothetical protein GWP62_05170 [Gammaproteobacteria bacterium]|jgi:hypothetical protein|nr:hypothetical protein [Gammaproteobacteria bacterium]
MRAFSLAALLIFASSLASAGEPDLTVEVGYLIDSVSESGCKFVRNGKEHTASEAADHLRMKARRGKRYYDTVEEFIDRIASKSSWSGKPYTIQCGDKPAVTAGDWFTRVLTDYREKSPG